MFTVAAVAMCALVALRVGLARAPLAMLAGVALLGLALHTGVVALPSAVTSPLSRAQAAVHAWQDRQARALACDLAESRAAMSFADRDVARAEQLCVSER